jgi:hypothetical protein
MFPAGLQAKLKQLTSLSPRLRSALQISGGAELFDGAWDQCVIACGICSRG